jgi:hypothetical protein
MSLDAYIFLGISSIGLVILIRGRKDNRLAWLGILLLLLSGLAMFFKNQDMADLFANAAYAALFWASLVFMQDQKLWQNDEK